MTDPDPRDHGYSPALWLPGTRHFLRPDGHSICTYEQAVAEIAEAAVTALGNSLPQNGDEPQ
jgi:hypothetical protein